MVDLAGRVVLAAHLQADHLGELLRYGVTDDRDDTYSTAADHRERERVVAGDDVEVARLVLNDLIDLFEIAAGLLDGDDVLAVAGQADGGLSLEVDARTSGDIIKYHGQLCGCGDGIEMLV